MALQKTFLTEHGVTGVYWKISNIEFNYVLGLGICTLSLYKDSDCKDLKSLHSKIYSISFQDDFDIQIMNNSNDIRIEIYNGLKLLDFSDAIDC
jgi:hypothetical protein